MPLALALNGLKIIHRSYSQLPPTLHLIGLRNGTRNGCFESLHSAFGGQAPSYTTVKNWYVQFKRGRTSLGDEPRGGRPKTVVVPVNIDAVRELIEQDRNMGYLLWLNYLEIQTRLGILAPSVHSILHEHLEMQKL